MKIKLICDSMCDIPEEINNKDKKTIPDFLIFAISFYYKLISTIIQDKEKDKDV